MAKIKFTSALKRFFPKLEEVEAQGATVSEVLKNVEKHFPGISDYVLNERGALRQHMNIFVKGELIQDRQQLSDQLEAHDEILIFQALSGG